jgi:hypothetical protein
MSERTPDRAAVVVPGMMYGPHAPLLMYASDAAEARGARVRHVSWTGRPPAPDAAPEEKGRWVLAEVAPVLEQEKAARPAAKPLLIAKSLGTHAAALAADRDLPAIWLTPLLTSPWVVDALRSASAPFLLVGGTADKLWDGPLARQLTSHVLEVRAADHGMYVPGRLAASAAVLGQVATAIEDFLDRTVWVPAMGAR